MSLASIPVVSFFRGQRDCSFKKTVRFFQFAAKHQKLAQRIQNHRQLVSAVVSLASNRQSAFQGLLRTVPLAKQNEIDAEVVIAFRRARLMIGSFVIGDRFFEVTNAIMRPLKKPTRARHVCVSAAEQITRRMIADQFDRLAKVLDRRFVLAFLNICDAKSEVRFRQSAPLTTLAITLERAM